MKKYLYAVMVMVGFVLLMILPGFVYFIVGTIADKSIPDMKEENEEEDDD